MQRCLEFFFYIPNDIFNRQVIYDSTFTNMETLFNLTLYDVKIQKYMSNSLKKKKEEKNPTIYMLTYISIQTPYNKHAKVSGLLSNAFLNYLE